MKNKLIFIIGGLLLIAGAVWFTMSGSEDKPLAGSNVPEEIIIQQSAIKSEEGVKYFAGAEGYLARPQDNERHPGIILIHEWWGLNQNMKDLANEFAKEGYIALAVDLYDGQVAGDAKTAGELAGSVRNNTDEAFDNLNGAVAYLSSLGSVDPNRIASVGWCFGGGWSYQMAINNLGVAVSVMYYGQFDPEDDFSKMTAHIIGHFGEKDMSIKVDDAREFEATLKTISGDHEIFIYPNAGHGFANPSNPNYSAEAAATAWQRTLTFLTKNL